MENYPDAISFFEDIIEDPDTELDSVYAVIDAGYTYLLMENSGSKGYVGRLKELKPKSENDFHKRTDELLAMLLKRDTDKESAVPSPVFGLSQNYPNPFNPETIIKYEITNENANTELKIYNIKGQLVRKLVDGKKEVGKHSVVWNGRDSNNREVSSGVYLYRLKNGKNTSVKKMVLIR